MRSMVRMSRRSVLSMIVAGMLLAGCSLPFGGESAPQIVPQTGTELQFTNYTHPQWGYTVDIPQGASPSNSRDGRITTITYADDTLIRGRYVTQIEVVPEIGARTPDQMIQEAAQRINPVPSTSPITTLDGALQGAQITFDAAKGEVCETRNAIMAAYVVGNNGYLVRVTSDGLNRCDTDTLPETQRVIGSFRPPSS